MKRSELDKFINGQNKILIVGLGITGIETALFLNRCNIPVVCVERASESDYFSKNKFAGRIGELKKAAIPYHFGIDGEQVAQHLTNVALAVLSPGVSLESAIVGSLKRAGVRIVSELELGIELANVPVIMVTGSNGKSTTVSLIHHILTCANVPSLLCGNVGVPIVSALTKEDVINGQTDRFKYLVVEASSYQLEACESIKPKVGVFLNLSDNHLERHGSMQRYFDAKTRMLANQDKSDFAVLNCDDTWVKRIEQRCHGTVLAFGMKEVSSGATIVYNKESQRDEILLSVSSKKGKLNTEKTKLLGLHNRYDISAAALAVMALGVDLSLIQQGIDSFVPLEHRLEIIGEVSNRIIINDSKSTTVAASLSALQAVFEAYPSRKVILMLGGLAKAGSWEPLLKLANEHTAALRKVVCFGKDGRAILSHCEAKSIPAERAISLKDGLSAAFCISQDNDLILLSPGCASFDEFKDFEHRGAVFKELVAKESLKNHPSAGSVLSVVKIISESGQYFNKTTEDTEITEG